MMNLLFKWVLIKIKKSLGRFLSILFIIALGMGFFAGLRASSPSMLSTMESYYDNNNYMDIKIISSFGLTTNDIIALKDVDQTIKVIPTYSYDYLVNGKTIRIHAIEKEINNVDLITGRLPENDDECLGDNTYYHLNDKITIEDPNNYLKNHTYTVVGTINSVLYITNDKGITNIGNGKLTSFIFINKDNFQMDEYTECYLQMKDAISIDAHGEAYKKLYNDLYNKLLKLKPIREAIRYEEILKEASIEINKIENELNEKISDTKKDLTSTKKTLDNSQKELTSGINEIKANINKINDELKEQDLDINTIDIAISTINTSINQLNDSLASINKESTEYQSIVTYIESLNKKITSLTTLKDSYSILNNELDKLIKNQDTLDNSYQKYNDGITKLQEEETKAKEKINDAKKDLDTIEKPIWYIQNRTNNYGYSNFYDDASVVDSIAKIFPIFFILIVALIILNTITRMIEEERTEIGTLKSLGYGNAYIISMYLIYTFIASIIGTFIGLLCGYLIIPQLIFNIYKVTYITPKLIININIVSFILMIITGIILILSITIIGCLKELKDVPATLLRPKAPKEGKKVLLEQINIIWNKLSFIWKITIRNLFRYKKRIIMTIVGVAGSMALLIAGYGLRDSINNLANIQYNSIIKYDFLVVLDDNYSSISKDIISVFDSNSVNEYLLVNEEAYTFIDTSSKTNDVYLLAADNLEQFFKFNSTKDNKIIDLPNYGVIITSKMAKLLNVDLGDNINIRNSDNELKIFNVKGIIENYTLNYIYMSKSYYETTFNTELNYNSIIGNMNTDQNKFSSELIELNEVNTINYNSDNIKSFDQMITGLNSIVYLLIICACLLSIIILYNLNIININERKREIATLKVLGFNDKEVSSYVYRETLILTILGIALGLLLGKSLHKFVITTSEPANMVFLTKIHLPSYIYSAIFIFVFMYIVQLLTYYRLQKIDMIESLKSVE